MKAKISIIKKYSEIISELTRTIRIWISEQNHNPSEILLRKHIEEEFFASTHINDVDVCDVKIVVECIEERLKSKYGILSSLLEDPEINEVMVNGAENIFVERNRKILRVDNAFTSELELEELIRMFASDVHREINEANPIVDARLKSGFRVNGVLKNIALNGPILTIRKFSNKELELEDLIRFGSITEECAKDLSILVNAGYNIFISGGTSSGKTTFLNALARQISDEERVIVIEDSSELKLDHIVNKVHMECRNANSVGKGEVTMQDLIKTSLRMRPDRIIVGEVRGREVVDMIQAMNTGHEGSMSTGHGNSIKGMLNRLESMYLMDSQIPIYSVRNQIANAIDVFVHLKRDSNGERKVVELAELAGFNGEKYILNYLYTTDENGNLVCTGNRFIDRERLVRKGWDDFL